MSILALNRDQSQHAASLAQDLINQGHHVDSLVYLIFHTSTCQYGDEEIQCLSDPLPPGTDLSRNPIPHHTLKEIAALFG